MKDIIRFFTDNLDEILVVLVVAGALSNFIRICIQSIVQAGQLFRLSSRNTVFSGKAVIHKELYIQDINEVIWCRTEHQEYNGDGGVIA